MPVPARRRLLAVAAFEAAVVALPLFVVLVLTPLPWWVALPLALVLAAAVVAWWVAGAAGRILAQLDPAPADPRRHARLLNLVDGLCLAFGVDRPAVHVLDEPAPNAASLAGRGGAHLICTTGLLERLDRVELEGVLAHELAHVRSGETGAATTAVALIGYPLLGGAGPMGRSLPSLGRTLGPTRDRLWSWILGAEREVDADLAAVGVTRYPPGLYWALIRIRDAAGPVGAASAATVPLWIEPPHPAPSGDGPGPAALHPPLEHRIDVLGEL